MDELNEKPKYSKNIETGDSIQGIAFLEDDSFVISKHWASSLELWDNKCTLLSSLPLPGSPYGIKMTSSEEGAVAIWNKDLLFFKVCDKTIIETKRIELPVENDFIFHKGKYYIGSNMKIIIHDSDHQHERDVAVGGRVGYLAARDDDSICYTLFGGNVLHCVALNGSPVFQYSHDKLLFTMGVTVDYSRNIYVCGYISRNVHQLNFDGKLLRILFDNLPGNPYSIGFNENNNRAVIVSSSRVLLYRLTSF